MKYLTLILFTLFTIPNLDWRVYLDLFPEIREIAFCESGINNKALNPKDSDGTRSVGLLQFKDKTFYKWAKLAQIDKPDIWNPIQQIVLYRWADEQGLNYHWGCYNRLVKTNKTFRALYFD